MCNYYVNDIGPGVDGVEYAVPPAFQIFDVQYHFVYFSVDVLRNRRVPKTRRLVRK